MTLKIVLAPDSFKGALTAQEVADAMEKGIRNYLGDQAEIIKVPMADGGEGTVQSLVDATKGDLIECDVTGPLHTPVKAKYGILGDGETAVIEMAEASGMAYVNEESKNPLITTTYGTGELILDAIKQGIKKIILGIGGSATNDGGSGMAQALGYSLLDSSGQEISFGGGALDQLAKIKTDQADPKIDKVEIIVASDVSNPLLGPEGASAVFGPQKGANAADVQVLDKNLSHFSKIIEADLGKSVQDIPGAGAAGGLGAGLLAFTKAEMKTGVEIVVEYARLKEKAKDCDICFTGEGGIDFQTKYGKTPYGVAQAVKASSPNAKVIAICGSLGDGIEELYEVGIHAIFSTAPGPALLEDLISNSRAIIEGTTENVMRAMI